MHTTADIARSYICTLQDEDDWVYAAGAAVRLSYIGADGPCVSPNKQAARQSRKRKERAKRKRKPKPRNAQFVNLCKKIELQSYS